MTKTHIWTAFQELLFTGFQTDEVEVLLCIYSENTDNAFDCS